MKKPLSCLMLLMVFVACLIPDGPSNMHFGFLYIRYKESFSKSTRGWKERLFSRNNSISDGSEVRGDVNAGITNVSRIMERLETREIDRASPGTIADSLANGSDTEESNHNNVETRGESLLNDSNTHSSCAASSASH